MEPKEDKIVKPLLKSGLKVVSFGLPLFTEAMVAQGVRAVHVDWKPPAGGDLRLLAALEHLR